METTTTSPNHSPIHKKILLFKTGIGSIFLLFLSLMLFSLGCAKDADLALDKAKVVNTTENPNCTDELTSRATPVYEQVNIVSDVDEYNPAIIDPNLVNAWGLAFSPSQELWITSAHADYVVRYNNAGETAKPPLELEGDPIGIVYNTSSGFKIPGTSNVARFIFASEEGEISAWTPWKPDEVTNVLDYSGGLTSYTGLEIAKNKGSYFLYAANVGQGTIDVFDKNFNQVSNMPFSDPSLPAGAKPFNIRLINDKLYVTYVGPGGGYVNVFNTDGTFAKRFASGGTLAAPWGITKVPLDFGLGYAILVGNFGDGRINIYDYNGNFKGQLMSENGGPVSIDGLWALGFSDSAMKGTAEAELYFTAGPDDEEHGLFGYLEAVE